MILLTTSERQKPQSTAEDPQILRDASKLQTIDLKAASGWAQEVIYQTNNQLGWTCPRYILKQGKEAWNKIRTNGHILVEGDDESPTTKKLIETYDLMQ